LEISFEVKGEILRQARCLILRDSHAIPLDGHMIPLGERRRGGILFHGPGLTAWGWNKPPFLILGKRCGWEEAEDEENQEGFHGEEVVGTNEHSFMKCP
jgi:hypothetical protein